MAIRRMGIVAPFVAGFPLISGPAQGGKVAAPSPEGRVPVGIVSHVKVLTDHVEDVSSMDAWKRSFLRDGMTDEQRALAV